MSKKPNLATGEYEVRKTRRLLELMRNDLAKTPLLTQSQYLYIIKGLTDSLEHAVNTVEVLQKQMALDAAMALGMGSNATN